MSESNGDVLYQKYRPKLFKHIVGQDEAVALLKRLVESKKMPRALMLTGGSGVGKTSLARILQGKLKCSNHDYTEINCANFNGIDMSRDIQSRLMQAPLSGACRIWYLDEVSRLTGPCQDSLLKVLEDTPRHAYFILATTDAARIVKAIHTRCTKINLKPLGEDAMKMVVDRALLGEGRTISETVMDKLIDVSEGSARQALVFLHSILSLSAETVTDEQQLEILQAPTVESCAIDVCRVLMNPKATLKTHWKEVAKLLEANQDSPEAIRRGMLGYSRKVMLKGGPMAEMAWRIIEVFAPHVYESGAAGLAAMCYRALK